MIYRILSMLWIITVALIARNVAEDVTAQENETTPIYVVDNDRIDENAEWEAVIDPIADPSDDEWEVEVIDTLSSDEEEALIDVQEETTIVSSIPEMDDRDEDMQDREVVIWNNQELDTNDTDEFDDNDSNIRTITTPDMLPTTGVSLK